MTLFEQIVLEAVLKEGVEITDINTALDAHKSVNLYYHSMTKEDIAEGEREIYPIAYGISTAGNPVVRAYQPYGDSASDVPSWKLFRLDGIKNWEVTDKVFTTKDIPNLRIKHDDGMQIEYKSAFRTPSSGKDVPQIDQKRIDNTPVSKGEIRNMNNITQDIEAPAPQDNNVGNEPENLDIKPQTTHIPVGVNQNTVEAPDAKPISQTQIQGEQPAPMEEPEETPETLGSDSSNPIYQDDFENGEEDTEEELRDEYNVEDDEKAKSINSLMERIYNINR